MTNIFITGIGIISSIGYNIKETLDSILLSKSGLSKISILETTHNNFFAGEIKLTNKQLEKNIYNSIKNYSRTALLGMIAAKQAVETSGITNINKVRTELDAERLSWSSNNYYGAFASPLKFSVAGLRYSSNASLLNTGSYGLYWSSTVNGIYANGLAFTSSTANINNHLRALGYTVRCIKD